jgi:hypothetical protein
MDTPLHTAAMPGADRTQLKERESAAGELVGAIAEVLARETVGRTSIAPEGLSPQCYSAAATFEFVRRIALFRRNSFQAIS